MITTIICPYHVELLRISWFYIFLIFWKKNYGRMSEQILYFIARVYIRIISVKYLIWYFLSDLSKRSNIHTFTSTDIHDSYLSTTPRFSKPGLRVTSNVTSNATSILVAPMSIHVTAEDADQRRDLGDCSIVWLTPCS